MSHANPDAAAEYGFGGRLTAHFPSQIVVDVTEVCNLECIHCPQPQFKRSPLYGARYLDPALSAKMVDEVRAHGRGCTQFIRYTSEGEPLIHPHGYDMIEDAVKRSGVYVTLTTNGTIMNEKRTQRLLAAGVHMIDISIDALTEEVYARVRVGGDLRVTRTNVRRLIGWIRESRGSTRVVVSFVEQKENAHEAAAFKAFWEDQGADSVIIRRLHSAAGSVIDATRILREKHKAESRRPCLYPWERLNLNPRGFLTFCPDDWIHGSEIADFHQATILETWQGPAMRALREAHLANDFHAHAFCGQCPDWAETRWPHQGRTYADLVADLRASRE